MNDYNVRVAQALDLEPIYKIELQSMDNPWSHNLIENDLLRNIHSKYFVVENKSNEVIGFCATMLVIDEVHITNIAISKEYRGLGLGRMILDFAMKFYDEKKVLGITLEVNVKNNVALELYKSLGFQIVGTRNGYYANNEDAYVMWKYNEGDKC